MSSYLGRIVLVRIAYHSFSRRWDWQTLKKHGGGSLNNTCPHPIDQALVLLNIRSDGDEMPKVNCVMDRVLTLGDADDHVKIGLTGSGGLTVEIEVTSACAYPQDQWLVMGSRGGLAGSAKELKWRYVVPGELPERVLSEEPTADRSYNRDTDLPWKTGQWSVDSDQGPGAAGFYRDLYLSIREGRELPVTPESGRAQIRILGECRRQSPV